MTRNASLSSGRSRPPCAAIASCAVFLAGCVGPFDTRDFLEFETSPEFLREIERVRLADRSLDPPVSVEEAAQGIERRVTETEGLLDKVDLRLEDVRAAALENNLDLRVELVNPSVSRAAIDEEEAKFEWAFSASGRRSRTDSPTAVATEGTQVDFFSYRLGLDVPLRTGGAASIALPFSKTDTNNPFATFDPSYQVDLTFSITQPLFRGAWNRVNTHSIRVAKYSAQITDARTKAGVIRVLAEADRAYWALYAAQQAVDVSQLQYDLARRQLERAERRRQAGVVARIEVVRARAGVAQRLEAIIIARTAVSRSERDLKRIMNRDDLPMESEARVTLASAPDPLGLRLDPVDLGDFAVSNRMDMLEVEIQLAIDASAVEFQRNATLPRVDLDYTYNVGGLAGRSRPPLPALDERWRDAFGQIADRSFEDWSVGVTAEFPLGNEAALARLHQAVLARVQRLATRDRLALSIRQEVYDGVDRLDETWQRILAARQNVEEAMIALDAEENQFEQGTSTSTDVLDQAARLADAQLSEIRAVADYQTAQVDLAIATGTLLGYGRVRWEPTDVEREEDRREWTPEPPHRTRAID